ncbi:tetratricopeptide repeat protein [Pontiellaceae bacterium B12219]|nr:tetratricopeptide repeat protein [Pontiellaceae bacterium B12219]
MPNQRTQTLLVSLFLIGIIGIVFAIAFQSIDAPFIMDDVDQLNQTASQHSLSDALKRDCYGLYRPVKTCVFFVLSKIYPETPAAWRLVGLLIYAIGILLFHSLTRRLFPWAWALVATAIWALAPTQVSSFAWSSCINILIMTCAVLGNLLLYDRLQSEPCNRISTTGFIIGITLLYALAFFSYESAIVLPALLLIWSLLRKQGIWTRKNIATMLTCGATGLTLLFIRHSMKGNLSIENGSIHGFTPAQLSWASGRIIWDHFSLWFWPFGRQAITATLVNDGNPLMELHFILPWILIAAIALGASLIRKRCPVAAWGLAFFAVAFFPMSNLAPLFNGPYADYYLIVPSIGLTIAFTCVLRWIWGSRQATLRILLLLLCVLLPATRLLAVGSSFRWSKAWNNESDLFAATLKTFPHAYTARASLARCYMLSGNFEEAEALALESTKQAPWFRQSSYVLINIYLLTKRYEDALAESEKVLANNPPEVFPWSSMGYLAEHHLKDQEKAIEAYSKAKQLDWQAESENAMINVVRLLSLEGRDAEALAVLERVQARAPGAKIVSVILSAFRQNPDLFRDAAE